MFETDEDNSLEIISRKISLSPWRTHISQINLAPTFCRFNGECPREETSPSQDMLWLSQRNVVWWTLLAFILILTLGFIFLLKWFLKFRYSRNIKRKKPRLLSTSHVIFFSPNDDHNVPDS